MASAHAPAQSLTEVTTAVRQAETTEQRLARELAQQNRRTTRLRDTITDTAQRLAEGDQMPATNTTSKRNARKKPASSKPAKKGRSATKAKPAKKVAAASSGRGTTRTAITAKAGRKGDSKTAGGRKRSSPKAKSTRSSPKAKSTRSKSSKSTAATEMRQARDQLAALRGREKKIGKRVDDHDKTVKTLKKDLKRSEKDLATVHDNLADAKKSRQKAKKRLDKIAR